MLALLRSTSGRAVGIRCAPHAAQAPLSLRRGPCPRAAEPRQPLHVPAAQQGHPSPAAASSQEPNSRTSTPTDTDTGDAAASWCFKAINALRLLLQWRELVSLWFTPSIAADPPCEQPAAFFQKPSRCSLPIPYAGAGRPN